MSTTIWRQRMLPRDASEEHRASTPLELFFDLCVVVAVAQAASGLHHKLAEDHVAEALVGYGVGFFTIWWAWVNFTWFASAYDCDDVPYRLATFVQITGALVLAAGIPQALDQSAFTVGTLGYVIMRLGLVSQWLRAARSDASGRQTALRYATGVTACQVGWVCLLAVPSDWFLPVAIVLAVAELAVPAWAEHAAPTSWHPQHIAERYGLFTIIVLGESVLAAVLAIQAARDADGALSDLMPLIIGGLLILFSMWWIYFAKPASRLLTTSSPFAFLWGYGHLFVFASGGAVGAGIAVAVDHAIGEPHISAHAAGAAVTVPVAIYLFVVWALHLRPHHADPAGAAALPATALLVLLATFTRQPVIVTGLLLAVVLAVSIIREAPRP